MGESSTAMKLVLATLVVLAAISYAAELKIETTFKPEGCTEATMAKAGDHLSMHYTGTIDESSEADTKGSSAQGAGGAIPGGATLNFDVELLAISDKAAPGPNIFKEIDADENKELSVEELKGWFKAKQGQDELPPGLMENEDKDKDGVISYEEFSGPKGN